MLNILRNNIIAHELKQEKLNLFQFEDTMERDLFAHFTAAIKVSHEKEKIYVNTVKYWSIIGSIVGAVLGIAGTYL